MTKLRPEVQAFIVRANARFLSPTQVTQLVKEEFGVEVVRQHVRDYNPQQSKSLAKKWHVLYAEERAAFLSSVADVGLSHAAYRLAALQRLFDRLMDKIAGQDTINPQHYAAAQALLASAQQESALLLGAGAMPMDGVAAATSSMTLTDANRVLNGIAESGSVLPFRKRAA